MKKSVKTLSVLLAAVFLFSFAAPLTFDGTVKAGEETGVRLVNPRYYPAKKEALTA